MKNQMTEVTLPITFAGRQVSRALAVGSPSDGQSSGGVNKVNMIEVAREILGLYPDIDHPVLWITDWLDARCADLEFLKFCRGRRDNLPPIAAADGVNASNTEGNVEGKEEKEKEWTTAYLSFNK